MILLKIENKRFLFNEFKNPILIKSIDFTKGPHFGMPEQPFHAEAKAWLIKFIDKKYVKVQLLRKDQYGRLVSIQLEKK